MKANTVWILYPYLSPTNTNTNQNTILMAPLTRLALSRPPLPLKAGYILWKHPQTAATGTQSCGEWQKRYSLAVLLPIMPK